MSENIRYYWLVKFLIKQLGSDRVIRIDEFLGLRGWGLVLYGVLPANLAFFGILNTKLPNLDKISVIFVLGASIIPLFFIFMLISNQNKKWYLTKDKYGIRSLSITFLIFFLSTLIIGISGIIQGKYFLCLSLNSETIGTSLECLFSAISSLVISSSFFIIALTKNENYPLLPSISFTKSMRKIERNYRKIKSEEVWSKFTPIDDSFIKMVKDTENEINNIIISKGNSLAKISLEEKCKDLRKLEETLEMIQNDINEDLKKIHWDIYFDFSKKLKETKSTIRENNVACFNSLKKIKELELGD